MQKLERIALIKAQSARGVVPVRFGIVRGDGGFDFGREIGIRLEKRD